MGETFEACPLTERDPEIISAAFMAIGSKKTAAQYRRYLAEQAAGTRTCFVALVSKQFAGYVTVNWKPTYPPLRRATYSRDSGFECASLSSPEGNCLAPP